MNSMPPERGFGVQPSMGQRPAPRRMSVRRIICGIIWAVLTGILAAGGIAELTISNIGGAVLCLVLAVGSGWYDFRVWTLRARRLYLVF
jgi:hypothetical protein